MLMVIAIGVVWWPNKHYYHAPKAYVGLLCILDFCISSFFFVSSFISLCLEEV